MSDRYELLKLETEKKLIELYNKYTNSNETKLVEVFKKNTLDEEKEKEKKLSELIYTFWGYVNYQKNTKESFIQNIYRDLQKIESN